MELPSPFDFKQAAVVAFSVKGPSALSQLLICFFVGLATPSNARQSLGTCVMHSFCSTDTRHECMPGPDTPVRQRTTAGVAKMPSARLHLGI